MVQPLNKPANMKLPTEQAIRQYANRPFQESYTYNVNFDNLINGTTQSESLQIQSDSDFELSQMSVMVNNVNVNELYDIGTGEHYSGIVCVIADGASQVPLSNIPIPICSLFGTGKNPRILQQKRILERNSVLIFTLSNLYNTSDGDMLKIVISLQGEKFYRGFNV